MIQYSVRRNSVGPYEMSEQLSNKYEEATWHSTWRFRDKGTEICKGVFGSQQISVAEVKCSCREHLENKHWKAR